MLVTPRSAPSTPLLLSPLLGVCVAVLVHGVTHEGYGHSPSALEQSMEVRQLVNSDIGADLEVALAGSGEVAGAEDGAGVVVHKLGVADALRTALCS